MDLHSPHATGTTVFEDIPTDALVLELETFGSFGTGDTAEPSFRCLG